MFGTSNGSQAGVPNVKVRPTRRSQVDTEFCRDAPDDLLHLEDFNDNELLRALWQRYEQKHIYTWVGSVLVSVNPYRDIGAFKEETMARYAAKEPPQAPHLFATVRAALAAPGNRHALLITGESGAGKTEATRAILSFLALRQSATAQIRDRMMKSTPVLEAFGNAHTRQNQNSSRFGKFIEVYLSEPNNEVCGATLQPYMLEASRVAGVLPPGERTYHVFYLLRAALNVLASGRVPPGNFWARIAHSQEWTELARIAAAQLNGAHRLQTGPDEAICVERFEALYEGLSSTGLRSSEVAECLRIVAAVSLLADEDSTNDASLVGAADLLRIPEAELRTFLHKAQRSVGAAQREKFCRQRSEREAATFRSSVAQELYNALFGWLTRWVAKGIEPEEKVKSKAGIRMLGLLDLYGFEVFSSNGFEQFLINYCNERLQQFFNRQVFTMEAEEYSAEGLDTDGQWKRLMSACQLPALDMLEGEPGKVGKVGAFAIIDDRSRCNFEENSTSEQLAQAIATQCQNHAAYRRAPRDGSRVFGVKHFAGEVFYEAAQFVRKNASAHRPDIVAFLRQHGGTFVREVLVGDSESPVSEAASPGASPFKDVATPAANGAGRPQSRRKLFGRTLISVFQQELNELCAALEARSCRHIRCLRPNDDQAPLVFDDASMLRQARYSGLLEATRIRRQGYAHRRPLRTFAARYALILSSRQARRDARQSARTSNGSGIDKDHTASSCAKICEAVVKGGVDKEDARIGTTKVFMRESALKWVETRRTQVATNIVYAMLLGNQKRRQHVRLRVGVVKMQALFRGRIARAMVQWMLGERRAARRRELAEAEAERQASSAAVKLQSWWRSRSAVLQRFRLLEQIALEARAQEEQQRRAQRQASNMRAASSSPCSSPKNKSMSPAALGVRGETSRRADRRDIEETIRHDPTLAKAQTSKSGRPHKDHLSRSGPIGGQTSSSSSSSLRKQHRAGERSTLPTPKSTNTVCLRDSVGNMGSGSYPAGSVGSSNPSSPVGNEVLRTSSFDFQMTPQNHSGLQHSGLQHSGLQHSGFQHSVLQHSGLQHSFPGTYTTVSTLVMPPQPMPRAIAAVRSKDGGFTHAVAPVQQHRSGHFTFDLPPHQAHFDPRSTFPAYRPGAMQRSLSARSIYSGTQTPQSHSPRVPMRSPLPTPPVTARATVPVRSVGSSFRAPSAGAVLMQRPTTTTIVMSAPPMLAASRSGTPRHASPIAVPSYVPTQPVAVSTFSVPVAAAVFANSGMGTPKVPPKTVVVVAPQPVASGRPVATPSRVVRACSPRPVGVVPAASIRAGSRTRAMSPVPTQYGVITARVAVRPPPQVALTPSRHVQQEQQQQSAEMDQLAVTERAPRRGAASPVMPRKTPSTPTVAAA